MSITESPTEINASVDALTAAVREFDPYVYARARTMGARLRDTFVAFKATLQRFDLSTVSPAQRARLESRLLPLAKQARQKSITLDSLSTRERRSVWSAARHAQSDSG